MKRLPPFLLATICAGCVPVTDDVDPLSTDAADLLAQVNAAPAAACAVDPITIVHTTGITSEPAARLLDRRKHPNAVCNDGSPAYYHFRPGFGAGARRWLIYLEGGGACIDGPSCEERFRGRRNLMGSHHVIAGMPPDDVLEGIKSSDETANPDFYDVNYVQLGYCSSDGWSGARKADPSVADEGDVRHWHFRGKAIIDAVLTDLADEGLADASEVLLAGSSAGGMGVFVNADAVAERLPASTRFLALPDAGFFIDFPSYDPDAWPPDDGKKTGRMIELETAAMNWGGRGDVSCENAASDDDARLSCRSPSDLGRGPWLTTPFFIRQSLRDGVQLKNFVPEGSSGPLVAAYKRAWGGEMHDLLLEVAPLHAVFGSDDTEHGVINENVAFGWLTADGVRLRNSVGRWYRDPCAGSERHVDPQP